jgi:uncharacterized protein involved in type VI secretion and phage assembly
MTGDIKLSTLYFYVFLTTLLCTMKFMREYTPTVDETEYGFRVIIYRDTQEMGVMYYERAKTQWSRKPISTDRYVMVDCDLSTLMESLTPSEDEVESYNRMIREWGQSVIIQHQLSKV